MSAERKEKEAGILPKYIIKRLIQTHSCVHDNNMLIKVLYTFTYRINNVYNTTSYVCERKWHVLNSDYTAIIHNHL